MNHDHSHYPDHASHPLPARATLQSHQGHEGMASHAGHDSMVDDFRRRFWISLALTIPVLATSEMVQQFLGLRQVLAFPGDRYVEFVFASAIYFYGGWPFLTGLVDELKKKLPGMMTLVGLAISVAYLYSAYADDKKNRTSEASNFADAVREHRVIDQMLQTSEAVFG